VVSGLGHGGADPPYDAFKRLMGNAGARFATAFRRALTIFFSLPMGVIGEMGHGLVEPSTPSIASRRARPQAYYLHGAEPPSRVLKRQTILHRDMTKKSSFATKYEFERALYCGVCNARHPSSRKNQAKTGDGLKLGLECTGRNGHRSPRGNLGSIVAFLSSNS
jgi:hypothetical protein